MLKWINNLFKTKEYLPNKHGAIFRVKNDCNNWFKIRVWYNDRWEYALTDTIDTMRERRFGYPRYRDICQKSFDRDEMLTIVENYSVEDFYKEYILDVITKVKEHNNDLDQKIKRIKDKL